MKKTIGAGGAGLTGSTAVGKGRMPTTRHASPAAPSSGAIESQLIVLSGNAVDSFIGMLTFERCQTHQQPRDDKRRRCSPRMRVCACSSKKRSAFSFVLECTCPVQSLSSLGKRYRFRYNLSETFEKKNNKTVLNNPPEPSSIAQASIVMVAPASRSMPPAQLFLPLLTNKLVMNVAASSLAVSVTSAVTSVDVSADVSAGMPAGVSADVDDDVAADVAVRAIRTSAAARVSIPQPEHSSPCVSIPRRTARALRNGSSSGSRAVGSAPSTDAGSIESQLIVLSGDTADSFIGRCS